MSAAEIIVRAEVTETVLVLVEPPPPVEVEVYENGTVVKEGGAGINELSLTVETLGQTQFNIFQFPQGRHWLLINGVVFRPPEYAFATVSGNARLVYAGAVPLAPTDELVFVTF